MTPTQFLAFRQRLGLSQRALAVSLGMGQRQIQKYEAGEAPIPRTVALACAALALGLREYPQVG